MLCTVVGVILTNQQQIVILATAQTQYRAAVQAW